MYLTLWAFKADKSSFKSLSIGFDPLHAVRIDAVVKDGRDALSRWYALPVAILFVLHFLEGRELADGLFHRIAYIHYIGVRSPFGRCPYLESEIWGTRPFRPISQTPTESRIKPSKCRFTT